MNDYTQWPLVATVRTELTTRTQLHPALASKVSSLSDDQIQLGLDVMAQRVAHETQRTFLPVTANRIFDGSGTGEMEIDECIAVNSVTILGYLAQPTLLLVNAQLFIEEGMPNTRLQIFQGSLPAFGRIWLDQFPRGRSNIEVNAQWGYAATIPVDLWEGVLDGAALNVLRRLSQSPLGVITGWKDDDVSQSYEPLSQTETARYPKLERAIDKYRKTTGNRLRRRHRNMI